MRWLSIALCIFAVAFSAEEQNKEIIDEDLNKKIEQILFKNYVIEQNAFSTYTPNHNKKNLMLLDIDSDKKIIQSIFDTHKAHLLDNSMIFSNLLSPQNLDSSALQLNAIINNQALINNDWYGLYDEINGYKIIKINAKSITIQNKNTTKQIAINEAF